MLTRKATQLLADSIDTRAFVGAGPSIRARKEALEIEGFGRDTKFEVTRRKLAALESKQRREREALPLFAADIAAQQPTADAVMEERRQLWERRDRVFPEFDAQQWRRVRKQFYALPPETRQRVRERMERYWGPPDAGGWAYMIRECRTEEKGN